MKDKKRDAVGQKLCCFLTRVLGESYRGLEGKIELHFSRSAHCGEPEKKEGWDCKVCNGEVVDSRLDHNEKVSVCWTFLYQSLSVEVGGRKVVQNASWSCLGELLTVILQHKFSDILYLEEVEKRIDSLQGGKNLDKISAKEALADPLLKCFLGEILDDKKLRECYSQKVMEKCAFPECNLLIHISAQLYEKRTVRTRMYFVEENSGNRQDPDIRLDGRVDFGVSGLLITMDNLRTIRKLMEMAGEGQGLLVRRKAKTYAIEGLVSHNREGLDYYISFNGFLGWTAVSQGNSMLEYQNGNFRIPMADCDENKDGWLMELERLPKAANPDIIRETVQSLIKSQVHGTAILFMNNELLGIEVERLGVYKRAYKVEPFFVTRSEEALRGITSIDGALLADLNGQCYAVGAIVDGELNKKGDPSRGARYNSIENYINWIMIRKEKKEMTEEKVCFAAILSEDGMVNLRIVDS